MRERARFEHELRELAGERETGPHRRQLAVIDESDRPLDGARYAAHQGALTDTGTLSRGVAELVRVDLAKPFRFEVQGRVCAIKEGAVLLTDLPGVEYGGTFVDWKLA